MPLIFGCLILCVCLACAHQAKQEGDETQLRERIDFAWKAKINNNQKELYDLTTDAYKKQVHFENFVTSGNVVISAYEIKEIVIDGGTATTQIEYEVNQMGFPFKFKTVENWLWEKGEWRLDAKPAPKKTIDDVMPKMREKKQ